MASKKVSVDRDWLTDVIAAGLDLLANDVEAGRQTSQITGRPVYESLRRMADGIRATGQRQSS